MIGKELTDEALRQINTVKQDSYGTPEDSFQDIAERWTQHIKHELRRLNFPKAANRFVLLPKTVALMMVDLKTARELHKEKRDNCVDGVGYFCLYDELKMKRGKIE